MSPVVLKKAKKTNQTVDWSDWSAHDNCAHVPNADTIAALEETEEIILSIKAGIRRPYKNFAEIVAEIKAELETEENVQS